MENPYFSGVGQAKQAQPDKQDALQLALAQLASSVGKQPVGEPRRGLLNNLAQFGPAIADANLAYTVADQAEAKREQQLMNEQRYELLKNAREEQKYTAEQEWKERAHELAERKLDADGSREIQRREWEAKKHADNMAYKEAKLNSKLSDVDQTIDVNGKAYDVMTDKADIRNARAKVASLGNSKLHLQTIGKQINELESIGNGNVFTSVGGLSEYANPIKDTLGRILGAKQLQQETSVRKTLYGEMNKLNMELEKALTGRAMTQGMYDRLKSSYPDFSNDDWPTIKEKLAYINEEVSNHYNASRLSVEHKAYINPHDLHESEENDHLQAGVPEGFVSMKTPDGRLMNIPADRKEEALSKGLEYAS